MLCHCDLSTYKSVVSQWLEYLQVCCVTVTWVLTGQLCHCDLSTYKSVVSLWLEYLQVSCVTMTWVLTSLLCHCDLSTYKSVVSLWLEYLQVCYVSSYWALGPRVSSVAGSMPLLLLFHIWSLMVLSSCLSTVAPGDKLIYNMNCAMSSHLMNCDMSCHLMSYQPVCRRGP